MQPIWNLEEVHVYGSDRPRLRCDRLTVLPGVTAVMGESGAGKSTLLNLLVGFASPDAGRVRVSLPHKNGRLPLFWVPQNDGLWPHLTVWEHLAAVKAGADKLQCEEVLKELNLEGLAERRVESLSVGEQSRLAVSRAVMAYASVTVFDEPLSHVDRLRRSLHWSNVLGRARDAGLSVVFATHTAQMVLGHADRVILLREGCVQFEGTVDDLYWRPANADAAAALGAVNWLEHGEAALWLPGASESCNYRPTELMLEAAPAGSPLRLEGVHFGGDVTEVNLCHERSGQRRTFSVLTTSLPAQGRPVRLSHRPVPIAGGDS